MITKYKHWNSKELNELVSLHNAGHSTEMIAESLQRTTGSINAKREQLRTEGRIKSNINHWTNKQVKTAIEMLNDGHSHTSIGQAINRSRPSVSNMIKRLVQQGQITSSKEKTL
ncbi:hypothetical protein DX910_14510 [Acinetobacter haemolyticus]|nr:hypothetical protein DX910_14510 [Acinetobacter haemolyticus]